MFDILAKLLSSVATFLFPVFASYKALKGNDPAQLTPWLMYWVVLACALLVESWLGWILFWVPFYAWIRAVVLLYLVMPQTQGARLIYQHHIHPFLATYEAEIDDFISSAHDRARAAGLQYLKGAIDLIKKYVFGMQQQQQTSASSTQSPQSGGSYAQNLLARFHLPAAREGAVAPTAGDFYSFLTAALGQAVPSPLAGSGDGGGASSGEQGPDGTGFPSTVNTAEDRMSYLAAQRDRLRELLSVLDREASKLSAGATQPPADPSMAGADADENEDRSAGTIRKNRSEVDFESVERDDTQEEERRTTGGGGWMPWNWGAGASKAETSKAGEPEKGKATGIDAGR